jgi:histidine ammonia-lyase
MPDFHAGLDRLTPGVLSDLVHGKVRLILTESVRHRLETNRRFLEESLAKGAVIYGVNTGFGKLCQTRIAPEALRELQKNLILSHSCGTGPSLPFSITRMMLALKIHSLALGSSGVRPVLCDYLLKLWDSGWAPVVPMQGSLGASGDLAPLAHMVLPLLGLGQVMDATGRTISASQWLLEAGVQPLELETKEGLALLNGTQYMAAVGAYVADVAERLFDLALEAYVLSSWAWGARRQPLHPALHHVRSHSGQADVAERCRHLWQNLPPQPFEADIVQDPYSFRCMPQVAGASLDALRYVQRVLDTELNSVTDNPLVLHEEGLILSGGNFHGQPLALAYDFAAMALAELGAISERRQYRLLSGKNGLPAFLADNPGIQSGYMIVQYTAAALVSASKQLCTPASVDSLESSDGQEDHVSMGANAANKLLQVLDHTLRIVALEWLIAGRAALLRTHGNLQPFEALPHGRLFLQKLPHHHGDALMVERLQAAEIFVRHVVEDRTVYK